MLSSLNCLCTFVKHQATYLSGPTSGLLAQVSNISISHLEISGQLVGVQYMSHHQNSEPGSGTVIGSLIHLFCDSDCRVCNPFSLQPGPHIEYWDQCLIFQYQRYWQPGSILRGWLRWWGKGIISHEDWLRSRAVRPGRWTGMWILVLSPWNGACWKGRLLFYVVSWELVRSSAGAGSPWGTPQASCFQRRSHRADDLLWQRPPSRLQMQHPSVLGEGWT